MRRVNFKSDKVGQLMFSIENRVDDQSAEIGFAVFAVVGQLLPKRNLLMQPFADAVDGIRFRFRALQECSGYFADSFCRGIACDMTEVFIYPKDAPCRVSEDNSNTWNHSFDFETRARFRILGV